MDNKIEDGVENKEESKMGNELEILLQKLIERFNEKVKYDKKLMAEVEGLERKIQIELADGKKYHFSLKDSRLSNLEEGAAENPDATVISDTATLLGVIKREIAPFKALATRKIVLKASLADKVRLGRLLTSK